MSDPQIVPRALFQSLGATYAKDLSPLVNLVILVTIRSLKFCDCRERRDRVIEALVDKQEITRLMLYKYFIVYTILNG